MSDQRSAASDQPPRDARARLATLGTGAAWLLGIAAALELVAYFLGSSSLAEAVVGALVVDIATGRAGVAWTVGELSRSAIARRVGAAAALGGGVFLLTYAVGAALGWTTSYAGRLDTMAFLSAIGVVAIAIRDELLLRGLVFRFGTSAGLDARVIAMFSATLSGAFMLARGGTPSAVALAIGMGLLFAAIYIHMQGAAASIGAHAAWSLAAGPLSRGSVGDIEWAHGDLLDAPSAAGLPPLVAASVAAVAAVVLVPRVSARLGIAAVEAGARSGEIKRGDASA